MLSRHLSTAWLTLTSLLLVAACSVEPGNTDSDTNTSAATETGDDSDGECAFDGSDAIASAEAQPLVLTNSGSTALFVIPPTCGYYRVSVDGVPGSLGTRVQCSSVVNSPPCYDGCDGDYLTPPIRVDPGASLEWPINGYVWNYTSIPDSCRPDCSQPEISSCGIGHLIDEGALVELQLRVASECALDQCECPVGETACLLDGNPSAGDGSGPSTAVAISFTHGSPDTVMFDLAG
jgi:hypothetical protein